MILLFFALKIHTSVNANKNESTLQVTEKQKSAKTRAQKITSNSQCSKIKHLAPNL